MAKGQMEVMGLAIVVLLLMLGILFAVRFVLLAPDEDLAGEFRDAQLAANTVTVALKTHTDCYNATVTGLLQDCATTASLRCPSGSSCVHAKTTLAKLFSQTLDRWDREYDLSVSGPRRVEDVHLSRGECGSDRESKAHSAPVPTTSGTITVTLRLCR